VKQVIQFLNSDKTADKTVVATVKQFEGRFWLNNKQSTAYRSNN
jgi:hypothetical protein